MSILMKNEQKWNFAVRFVVSYLEALSSEIILQTVMIEQLLRPTVSSRSYSKIPLHHFINTNRLPKCLLLIQQNFGRCGILSRITKKIACKFRLLSQFCVPWKVLVMETELNIRTITLSSQTASFLGSEQRLLLRWQTYAFC